MIPRKPPAGGRRAAIAVILAAACAAAVPLAARSDPARTKVLALGFDGADYNLMRKFLAAGKLPNIAALEKTGTVAPLLPTNPAQTPVSWTAWATGKNPGKTEIFDFLKRDPGSKYYLPTFAMNEEKRKPFALPILGRDVGTDGLVLIFGGLALAAALALLKILRAPTAVALGIALLCGGGAWAGARFGLAPRYLPKEIPYAINNAKGETFWEIAGKSHVRSRIVHVPGTFPAREFDGELLAGLGVPDIRGRVGTPSYYTDDPRFRTGDNEFSLELIQLDATKESWDADVTGKPLAIFGPQNQLFYDKAKDPGGTGVDSDGNPKVIKFPIRIHREGEAVTIEPRDGRSWSPAPPATLKAGQWSDWVTMDFKFKGPIAIKGFGRFRLFSVSPLRLYLSPINLHPKNAIVFHNSPISQPEGYVAKLYKQFGLFKTIGWAVDTWTLSSDLGDEKFFEEDVEYTVGKEMEILEKLTASHDVDLYVQVFEFTDRVGHLIWRLIDPQHPRYDAAKAAQYGDLLEKSYVRMDALVGQAMKAADPDTLLLVSSDHGFTSYRRSMNYNTWLIENGFMVVRDRAGNVMNLEDLFSHKVDSFFVGVDWSQTKAYALGLGALYVNLEGREPQGSVAPQDYEVVRQQIIQGLESYVDPLTGEKPIFKVYKREEMYTGFDPGLIPDLRVANTENYRVSWQTSLGGFPAAIMQDNDKNWSGDHCSVEPSLVKGILLSNRKLRSPREGDAQVIDVCPTILKALAVPVPADMDGKPLL